MIRGNFDAGSYPPSRIAVDQDRLLSPAAGSFGPMTREFRLLWSALSAGGLALWMLRFALPLAALAMTRSPAAVATIAAASRVPGLAFGLAAGIAADRSNRRSALAGALILATASGIALLVALTTASLAALAVAAVALASRLDRARFEVPRDAAPARLATHVMAGLRFIWAEPVLRTITLIGLVINGCWSAWLAVFVVFAVAPGQLRMTEFEYGVLLSAGAIGGLVGLGLAGPVTRHVGRRWLIGLNIVSNGILFGAPLVTNSPVLLGGAMLLGGIGGPIGRHSP